MLDIRIILSFIAMKMDKLKNIQNFMLNYLILPQIINIFILSIVTVNKLKVILLDNRTVLHTTVGTVNVYKISEGQI